MIIIIITLSFILEFLFNSIFYNSLLLPLTTLVSLILLEPFFNKDKNKYLIFLFLIGLLYDVIFTGNHFLNAAMFLIIGCLVVIINKNTPNNLFKSLIEIIILISIYRTLCFALLGMLKVIQINFNVLLESIYKSLIFNIIYGITLYIIMCFISKKFNIRRIN